MSPTPCSSCHQRHAIIQSSLASAGTFICETPGENHISVEILTKNLISLSLTTSEVSDIYAKVAVRLPGGSATALFWSEEKGGDQSATMYPCIGSVYQVPGAYNLSIICL